MRKKATIYCVMDYDSILDDWLYTTAESRTLKKAREELERLKKRNPRKHGITKYKIVKEVYTDIEEGEYEE